jgi:hypothetical protein
VSYINSVNEDISLRSIKTIRRNVLVDNAQGPGGSDHFNARNDRGIDSKNSQCKIFHLGQVMKGERLWKERLLGPSASKVITFILRWGFYEQIHQYAEHEAKVGLLLHSH